MGKVLNEKFFERAAPEVAKDLLGKYLVKKGKGKGVAYRITETEAYEGADDLASHASKGRTARTEVMFGHPGIFYVYLIYGMYYMLNIVTGGNNHPAAVLIRGTEGMKGPGILTRELQINKKLNGKAASLESGFWFEDRGEEIEKFKIKSSPRVGVSYAGPMWSKKLWRFSLEIA